LPGIFAIPKSCCIDLPAAFFLIRLLNDRADMSWLSIQLQIIFSGFDVSSLLKFKMLPSHLAIPHTDETDSSKRYDSNISSRIGSVA